MGRNTRHPQFRKGHATALGGDRKFHEKHPASTGYGTWMGNHPCGARLVLGNLCSRKNEQTGRGGWRKGVNAKDRSKLANWVN